MSKRDSRQRSWIRIHDAAQALGVSVRSAGRLCGYGILRSRERGRQTYVQGKSLRNFLREHTPSQIVEIADSVMTMQEGRQYLGVSQRTMDRLRWDGIIKTAPYNHGYLTLRSELDAAKSHPYLLEQSKSPPKGCPTIEEVAADWKVSYNAVLARLGNEISLKQMESRSAAPKKRTPGKIDFVTVNRKRYLCRFEVALEKERRDVFFLPPGAAPEGMITTLEVGKQIGREDRTVRLFHQTRGLPLEDVGGRLFAFLDKVLAWRGRNMRQVGESWILKPKPSRSGWITAKQVSALFGYATDITRVLRERFPGLKVEKKSEFYRYDKEQILALRDAHYRKAGKRYLPKPRLNEGEATSGELCKTFGFSDGDLGAIRSVCSIEYRPEFHTYIYNRDEFTRALHANFRKKKGVWIHRASGRTLRAIREARRAEARELRKRQRAAPQPIQIPEHLATPTEAAAFFGRSIHWLHMLTSQFGVVPDETFGRSLYPRDTLAKVRAEHFVERSGRWITRHEAAAIPPPGKLTRLLLHRRFGQKGAWFAKFAKDFPSAVDPESDGELFHEEEVSRIQREYFVQQGQRWIRKPEEPALIPSHLWSDTQVAEYFGQTQKWVHVLRHSFGATCTVVGMNSYFVPKEVEAIRARYFIERSGRWIRVFEYPEKGVALPEGKLPPRAAANLFGRRESWLWRLELEFAIAPEPWRRVVLYDKPALLQIRADHFRKLGAIYERWPPPGKVDARRAAALFGRGTKWAATLKKLAGVSTDDAGLFDEAELLALRERAFVEKNGQWTPKPGMKKKSKGARKPPARTRAPFVSAPRKPTSDSEVLLAEASSLFGHQGAWARSVARRYPEITDGDLENPVFHRAKLLEVRELHYEESEDGRFVHRATSPSTIATETTMPPADDVDANTAFAEVAAALFGRSAPFLRSLERAFGKQLALTENGTQIALKTLTRIRDEHFTEESDGETSRWRWQTLSQRAAARLLEVTTEQIQELIASGELTSIDQRLERGEIVERRYRTGAPEGFVEAFAAAELIQGSQTALEMYVESGLVVTLETPRGLYYAAENLARIAHERSAGRKLEEAGGLLSRTAAAEVLADVIAFEDLGPYVRSAVISEVTQSGATCYYAVEIQRLRESLL